MNTDAIQHALTSLVGLPLRFIGRAANMLMLDFGEMREVATRKGGTATVCDWAIHVQCAWRLCRSAHIELACRDYYYDPGGEVLSDWDTPGKSRFDQKAVSLTAGFATSPPEVVSFTVDDVGGFSLHLSQGFRLDVFPANSSNNEYTEHWRLFAPAFDQSHFVVPCA